MRGRFMCIMVLAAGVVCLGQDQSNPPPPPSLFIRVFSSHMEPSAVSVKAGPVVLFVQNASTAPSLTIDLDRVGGSRVNEVKLIRKPNSLQEYVLTPGQYVLSAAGHPSIACTITVK